jgi:hypothetical protein
MLIMHHFDKNTSKRASKVRKLIFSSSLKIAHLNIIRWFQRLGTKIGMLGPFEGLYICLDLLTPKKLEPSKDTGISYSKLMSEIKS